MASLSVVMIVKNEAGNLAACLKSVHAIAHEIVIGDTGSTDDTKYIARQFNARVFDVPWRDDFALARNAVLAEATGDWLLHLDADEVVDAAGAARIHELLETDGHGADAIEVTLANYCDDPRAWRWTPCAPNDPAAHGYSGYIKVGLLRLFRNRRGYVYREPVHENVTESVAELGGVVRAEPILIHHYGYTPPQLGAAPKQRLYLEIGRKKTVERPHDSKAWHDYAEQLLACGDAEQSEQACRKALALAPTHLGASMTLANLLLNRGDYSSARELLDGLVAHGPVPSHVLIALGAIALREGRHDKARQVLMNALAEDPESVMASLYLARAYDVAGAYDEAAQVLRRLRARVPNLKEAEDREVAHRLRTEGEALFEQRRAERALQLFADALRRDPDDPLTHNNIGVVTLALGDADRAREYFRRALSLAPGLIPAQENLAALA